MPFLSELQVKNVNQVRQEAQIQKVTSSSPSATYQMGNFSGFFSLKMIPMFENTRPIFRKTLIPNKLLQKVHFYKQIQLFGVAILLQTCKFPIFTIPIGIAEPALA